MSENREFEINQGFDPLAFLPGHEGRKAEKEEPNPNHQADKTIDSQSYFTGEVPQNYLVDPSATLPLNSDRLIGSINLVDKLLFEIGVLIEEEVAMIQKHQKKIAFWEDRIEKNRAQNKKNEFEIKQNASHALHDKKNRDYWLGRAEEVETDYSHAEIAARIQDWSWLIKKYGLKNSNGIEIDPTSACVEELCNGESKNLAATYRATGNKYETSRKEKENENGRLVRENSKLQVMNDTLQKYIAATYANQIEPLQDGVLLMKELGLKVKTIGQNTAATFGEMRAWAEQFLDEFIRSNPKIPQDSVTHFRRLTSIPLPPEYC